jgi:predicted amidohydrolase YtcJ
VTPRTFALLLLSPLTLCAQQNRAATTVPDTIYFHGDILTGAHLQTSGAEAKDPTPARVTALAIGHGTLLAVGSDAAILKLKSPATKLVDLNGAFVMPGFNDAHTHLALAGQQKLTVDLDHVASLAEMQQRIRSFAATLKPGAWIKGFGWDHTLWPGAELPTRTEMDTVTAGHPAVFTRTDGHIVVANSAALAAAGITAATPDPAGAKIDHDASGELTGIVREEPATSLIFKVIPPVSPEERRAALSIALADASSHGVTSVQDLSDWQDFAALEDLERSGKLTVRVSEWLAFDTPLDVLKQRSSSHPTSDPMLHTGMLKGFMDGSLGSRTAALKSPYSDDPKNSGIPRYGQQKLDRMSAERAEAGYQLGFHAIGDRANDMALIAFAQAQQAQKKVKSWKGNLARYRIEHAQVVSAEDYERFYKLHVIASMQPSHLLTDMNWVGARLGPERVKDSYAWRSFLDHHVTLAFGTDYPVESINPFRGLYAATTRQNEAGTANYQLQERITLNEALFAYTQASAFAEMEEKSKGRLEPGYLADFVLLDRDITKADPQQLLHTRVLRTVLGGQVVFTAPSN